jgi:hypothetical protein
VIVSGQVTVDGAPMPNDTGNRGSLEFGNGLSAALTAGFGSSGPVSYEIALVADEYEVVWNGEETLCADASAVPCNDTTLLADQALTQSGALDLDVASAAITGSVTVDGATMPDEAMARGALRFTDSEGRVVIGPSFGTDGSVDYAITLAAGTYTVGLDGNLTLCNSATPVGVPCMVADLFEAVLTQDGLLDVDIPTVQVSGTITIGGQPMPDWSSARGSLWFARASAPAAEIGLTSEFGSAGVGSYWVTLVAGTYDVGWKAAPGACAQAAAPVPCIDGPIQADVVLEQNGALDLDVEVISVSGGVTLDGATMPTAGSDRGLLAVRHVGGASTDLPGFGSMGAVDYAISLIPGEYLITHVANPSLCGDGLQPQVPCMSQIVLGCE